jgi:hypothetical protein
VHRVALPLVLIMAVLGGCASATSERDEAAAVVERFYTAVEQQDGAAACAQLSTATLLALESQSGLRCREVVTRLDLAGGEVAKTEIFVTNAKVDLSSDESAFLSRGPEGWRLSAVGCKPPARQDDPYACEAEA